MNVLDENIIDDERKKLRGYGLPVRHIGYDLAHKGIQDNDQVIPLLRELHYPTFFTLDEDYYKRYLGHTRYCLVQLVVRSDQIAKYVRQVLRHRAFNTQAKRMGCVIRASSAGLTVWRLHLEQEVALSWRGGDGMSRGIIGRYIVKDTSIRDGAPTFRGTEVTVAEVLNQVADGVPWETIIKGYNGTISKAAITEAMTIARLALLEHYGAPSEDLI